MSRLQCRGKRARYHDIIQGILAGAPILFMLIAVLFHIDPLSLRTPWAFVFALPATNWLVRRLEHLAGRVQGIPDSKSEKMRAFTFGFTRIFELIVVLWWPHELFALPAKSDLVSFLVSAKVASYLSYLYWVRRLSVNASDSARSPVDHQQ